MPKNTQNIPYMVFIRSFVSPVYESMQKTVQGQYSPKNRQIKYRINKKYPYHNHFTTQTQILIPTKNLADYQFPIFLVKLKIFSQAQSLSANTLRFLMSVEGERIFENLLSANMGGMR